jgi:hypothetical protein
VKKLLFASTLSLCLSFGAFGADLTGYISDAACAKKDVAKAESDAHAGCAQGCAKKGQALVLVSGGKVYQLDDQTKAQPHAGHKVTVSGKVEGDKITVSDIKM